MIRLLKIVCAVLIFSLTLAPLALAEEFDEAQALESIREMFDEETELETSIYSGDLAISEDLSSEWTNFLLLGTDNRTNALNGLTDSMIILSINKETCRVKMTSIMRDTWVQIQGKGENKINAANVYGGPFLAMRTVNEHFGMNIQNYILVNFSGLSAIIDELGGVDITITSGEQQYMNMYLDEYRKVFGGTGAQDVISSGLVHLTGAQATAFARIRYIDSDYERTQRQRAVLLAMADKIKGAGMDKMLPLVQKLLKNVDTNIGSVEIAGLVGFAMQFDLEAEDAITEYRIPVDGTFTAKTKKKIWRIQADFEENTRLLKEFIYG